MATGFKLIVTRPGHGRNKSLQLDCSNLLERHLFIFLQESNISWMDGETAEVGVGPSNQIFIN